MRRELPEIRARLHSHLGQLEVLLVLAIMGVTATALIFQSSTAMGKARTLEAMTLSRALLPETVERIAAYGSAEPSALTSQVQVLATGAAPVTRKSVSIASARDLEEAQATVTRAVESTELAGLGRRTQSARTLADLSDGVPTAVVWFPGLEAPVLHELRPVVQEHGYVINWLCGKQASWGQVIAKPARSPALEDSFLPTTCKARP